MLASAGKSFHYNEAFHPDHAIELSERDWTLPPVVWFPPYPPLVIDVIRSLVSEGGNIYAENSRGHTPSSLVGDITQLKLDMGYFTPLFQVQVEALKADMVYLTRRSLLLFFEAVCVADDLKHSDALQRVAAGTDLGRYIVGFL